MQFRSEITQANTLAETGLVQETYEALRNIPFADYCDLQLNVPAEWKALREFLPKMPSAEDQKRWVGDHGPALMRRSASLVRLYEYLSWRQTGSGLNGKNILDYGCGWGRVLRLLPYFANPNQIEGVDPMPDSLRICRESKIHSKVFPVSPRPDRFESPLFTSFDIVTIFSVFTHTPEWLTVDILKNCAAATRKDGRVICTIRANNWLMVRNGHWPQNLLERVQREYAEIGYSFISLRNSAGNSGLQEDLYGDTVMTIDYFRLLAERAGWKIEVCDRDPLEPFQICVMLAKI